jgi:hypothetical protein
VVPGQGDPPVFAGLRLHSDLHANILELMKIEAGKADALIIGLGHHDRIGGWTGRLESNRARMRL